VRDAGKPQRGHVPCPRCGNGEDAIVDIDAISLYLVDRIQRNLAQIFTMQLGIALKFSNSGGWSQGSLVEF